MFAAAQKLDNLCVIVDYNKWQATGRSNEMMALAPLRRKWAAFGWDAHEVDGHDVGALARADAQRAERHRQAGRAHRPHGQGQGRVVHGRRQQLALPHRRPPKEVADGAQRSSAWHEKRLRRRDSPSSATTTSASSCCRATSATGCSTSSRPRIPTASSTAAWPRPNMMGVAAGLAMCGPAAGRLHDHAVHHDALPRADPRRRLLSRCAGRRSSASARALPMPASAPTHHACEDIAFLRSLPEHGGGVPRRCRGGARRAARGAAAGQARLHPHGQEGRAGGPSRRAAGFAIGKAITCRDGDGRLPARDRQHAARGRRGRASCSRSAACRAQVVSFHTRQAARRGAACARRSRASRWS